VLFFVVFFVVMFLLVFNSPVLAANDKRLLVMCV
jgi:hypothetical protein